MHDTCDIAIIGGGAAGLTAAIFAGQAARELGRPLSIRVLDGAKSLGAKVLVSGGGRCNVTHDRVDPAGDFFAPSHNPVRNVLRAFDERATINWFRDMGIELKREPTGKLFPLTDSARTVLDALLARCHDLNIQILTNHRVTGTEFSPSASSFILHPSSFSAKRLILATGGRSLPKTGSDGAGYDLARSLGHSVTDTHPALVPLVLADTFFHAAVTGLALDVELSTFVAGKLADRRTDALLFTHFGISGPVVMDASRHVTTALARKDPVELRCNFLPGDSFETVDRALLDAAAARPKAALPTILSTRLPARLAEAILHHVAIPPVTTMAQLTKDTRRKLTHALTALPLPVLRDRGWNYAEVTAGGVPMSEIDFRTMESRKTPGLHLVGEILDVDGRIGGYNFQWAWSTGYLAGRSAARSLTPSA